MGTKLVPQLEQIFWFFDWHSEYLWDPKSSATYDQLVESKLISAQ